MRRVFNTKIIYLVISLILVLVMASGNTVRAEGGGGDAIDRFKKPMPEVESMPEDEFLKKTKLYEDVPYGDKILAYSIRYPKGWVMGEQKVSSSFQLDTKLFSNLNKWYGPPRMGGRSRMEVKAVNMEYQLTAEQWYLQYVLESGLTLQGFKVYSDKKVESLMIIMEGDISYYLRSVAIINGKRVVMAQYYVPMYFWNQEKAMQKQCIESFKVKNPKDELIEKMLSFQFLDIAEVKYPESWRVYAKPLRNITRMNMKVLNVRQTKSGYTGATQEAIEGQVDVTLVSTITSDSLLKEIDTYKKSLEGMGMLVGKKIKDVNNYKYNKDFSFAATEVYKGIDSTNDSVDYELWFTVLVSGNYYFFLTLLTPARSESYVTWARNTEAYKLIIENTAPYVEELNER